MKAVILAGGLGSRLSEETSIKPKPMVEIGGHPIIWHIMKLYSHHGINDFIICLGYKGYLLKEYFVNYYLHNADVTVDMTTNTVDFHASNAEPWRVTLVDTGMRTQTGGRLARVRSYIEENESFCLTYGDGVGDIDISASIDFHRNEGRDATMTVVSPPGRFGAAVLYGSQVSAFIEKPQGDGGRINAGFFICQSSVLDLIEDDTTVWEQTPLHSLANEGRLSAFQHDGFWKPMDTLREKNELEDLWLSGNAPWKVWA